MFQRVRFVGRENQVLPHLHEVLALCSSVLEKMNTEAARIGLIKRKLQAPQAQQFSTVTDLANTVNLQFQVASKLFKMVVSFGKRYLNDSYSVTLYLNMARLIRAEQELNELLKSSKDLLVQINFLRLQNACKTVFVAIKWKRKAQHTIKLRER